MEIGCLFNTHNVFCLLCYCRYFTSAESSKLAKSALTKEVEKNQESRSLQTEAAGPASKAPRMEAEPNTSSKSCFKGLYEEVLQEYDAEQGGTSSTATQVQRRETATQRRETWLLLLPGFSALPPLVQIVRGFSAQLPTYLMRRGIGCQEIKQKHSSS